MKNLDGRYVTYEDLKADITNLKEANKRLVEALKEVVAYHHGTIHDEDPVIADLIYFIKKTLAENKKEVE